MRVIVYDYEERDFLRDNVDESVLVFNDFDVADDYAASCCETAGMCDLDDETREHLWSAVIDLVNEKSLKKVPV